MLRSALLATFVALTAGRAEAQDPASDINFILRPTEVQAGDTLDVFPGDPQPPPPEPPPRSPPLAGPTGEEAIGPPLAGPDGTTPIGPLLAGPADPLPPLLPLAAPLPRPREPDLEPFAALGMKYGTFVIRPAIEIGVHATDNPTGGSEKRPSVGLVVAPEVNVIWSGPRHEVEADVRGEGIFYGEKELDERESAARLRARYDLTARTTLRAEAGYRQSLDRFSDPDTPDAAVERPAVEDLDAEIGATQQFGTLAMGLAGRVDRSIHEDVPLADGGLASRKELDNTEFAARFRAAFVRGGALSPYSELEVGQRDYDQRIDDSGFERASVWGEMRGGLLFDLGTKLTGEAALGFRHEDITDERLEDIDAATVLANLLWSPRRLTEIRFELSTDIRSTSLAGASGALVYSATLTAARLVSPRFRLETGLGFDHERFVGIDRHENTYAAFAGVAYALNRVVSVEARYLYERSEGSEPDDDSEANAVTLRLRLQR